MAERWPAVRKNKRLLLGGSCLYLCEREAAAAVFLLLKSTDF